MNSPHPNIDTKPEERHVDIFIAGGGALGCTFARILVEEGNRQVTIAEAGAIVSRVPGEHLKNQVIYQRDVDLFVNVVKGQYYTISTPPDNSYVDTLDPDVFNPTKPFIKVKRSLHC